MPVIPNLLERAFFRAGLGPRPLVDIAAAASFRALQAALRLELFELLARGPRTADALARDLNADPTTLAALLDLLEAAGHLRRRNGAYENSRDASRWLVRDAKGSSAAFVQLWTDVVFDEWDTLETSLQSGHPAVHMHEWLTARGKWPLFNAAMAEFPRGAADAVAAAVALPAGARSLLDVGGSHGLYAIAFCRRHPDLRATIFDLPMALERARDNVAAAGLGDRLVLRAGDLTVDDLGKGYDATLLFQLIHYYGDDVLPTLLGKVLAALQPGGSVVILDQLTLSPPTPAARAFLRTLALQYRVSLGGRLRPFGDVRRVLIDAGYVDVRRKRVLRVPGNELVIARRPA